ncbi:uncharacterized protein DUF4240 [Saccharothrix saharensis]|uniref:Uncharacterized protein DUF4240 n=1 Tax=Saccharothrix saharensis TaxID=571190 RepID=A0A543JRE3_9PSEU|nr:DUF4240 domain-containing protein [Saccharothrix saharensis]TQM85325.1 uncharacterized protein DUF4240 [Saccharothrix saharensis]
MEIDDWWAVVERARTAVGDRAGDRNHADDPLPDALTDELARLRPADIVDWEITFIRVTDSAYRQPLWLAAYLIEGGCGDDGFMDFRDGLILQGRDVFTRAVDDPDTLADVPVVRAMAGEDGDGRLGFQAIGACVEEAYGRVCGETDSFHEAVDKALAALTRPDEPAGPTWHWSDDDAFREHLPRLSALFPP